MELLEDAARRAIRFLKSLDGRPVCADPQAAARLDQLLVPAPRDPTPDREVLAQLDEYVSPATIASAGPRFFGFVIGGSLPATLAANYGKDVYCEKPCTKNIVESIALADTFRRTGRVFQAGTQRRSLPNFMFSIDLARRGKLGKLHTLYAHPGGLGTATSGWAPEETEPDKDVIDWDLYLGPSAWRPFNKKFLDGFNF